MLQQPQPVTIPNPGVVLRLAYLNGKPPTTQRELAEAIDQVLFCWSDTLADDDVQRAEVGDQLARLLWPHM